MDFTVSLYSYTKFHTIHKKHKHMYSTRTKNHSMVKNVLSTQQHQITSCAQCQEQRNQKQNSLECSSYIDKQQRLVCCLLYNHLYAVICSCTNKNTKNQNKNKNKKIKMKTSLISLIPYHQMNSSYNEKKS